MDGWLAASVLARPASHALDPLNSFAATTRDESKTWPTPLCDGDSGGGGE